MQFWEAGEDNDQPETIFVPSTCVLKEGEETRPKTCMSEESLLGAPSHGHSRILVRMSFGINHYTVAMEDRPPHGTYPGAAPCTFATSHLRTSEKAPGASHSFQTQVARQNIKAPAESFKYMVWFLTKLLNDAASAPLTWERGGSPGPSLHWSSAGWGKCKPDPQTFGFHLQMADPPASDDSQDLVGAREVTPQQQPRLSNQHIVTGTQATLHHVHGTRVPSRDKIHI